MYKFFLRFLIVVSRNYGLFLLSLLFIPFLTHADLIQQKILPVGSLSGSVAQFVDFKSERALGSLKKPLKWSIALVQGKTIHLSGEIANTNPTNQYSRQAVLILQFQDKKGGVIVSDLLPYKPQWGGNYIHLSVAAHPTPFFFEVKVPDEAVYANIYIAKTDTSQNVILKRLACVQTKPSSLFAKLVIACALFVILLVALCLNRRFAASEENYSSKGSSLLSKSLWFCVVTLAIVMAIVFLRNFFSVLERYSQDNSWSFVVGYLLFMLILSLFLYGGTHGRRRLAILTIMIACFCLNVVTIRLTHALYTQTMNFDFIYPAQCLLAPDVRIGHPFEYFYWCNYELLCSFLGKVFCRDIQVAQYLNAVCATAAIYPVFKLAQKIGGFAVAIFTSLLMGCSPTLLVYSTILTNEFLAASLLVFAFYFIVKALEADSLRLKLKSAISAGFFLGLAHLMKPIATMFIAAMIVMLLLEVVQFGWKRVFRCLVVWSATVGVFITVSECVQSACTEIAKPQIIAKADSDNIAGSLLTGLDVDSGGYYDRAKAPRYRAMTEEERIVALKSLFVKDYRRFPSLFLKKLARIYSDFGNMTRFLYRSTTEQRALPLWLHFAIFGWHFLLLGLVALGSLGIVVARKISEDRNRIGIMALLVVGAFTVALLLLEIHGRYMSAIYPILFLIIPYARVWFEKDNRLYQGGARMARLLKTWARRRWTKEGSGR